MTFRALIVLVKGFKRGDVMIAKEKKKREREEDWRGEWESGKVTTASSQSNKGKLRTGNESIRTDNFPMITPL